MRIIDGFALHIEGSLVGSAPTIAALMALLEAEIALDFENDEGRENKSDLRIRVEHTKISEVD